jgi:hypothetical protein
MPAMEVPISITVATTSGFILIVRLWTSGVKRFSTCC